MPQSLQPPWTKAIQASAAQTSTASTANFALPITSGSYSFLLNITAVSGTSPTMDCVLQTSIDGGTTYVDLPLRYAQKTAAGAAILVFRNGLGNNEVALEQAVADTGGTLAKNCNFDPSHMKIKYTIAGTSPSFTFSITAFGWPQGAGSAL